MQSTRHTCVSPLRYARSIRLAVTMADQWQPYSRRTCPGTSMPALQLCQTRAGCCSCAGTEGILHDALIWNARLHCKFSVSVNPLSLRSLGICEQVGKPASACGAKDGGGIRPCLKCHNNHASTSVPLQWTESYTTKTIGTKVCYRSLSQSQGCSQHDSDSSSISAKHGPVVWKRER